MVFASVLPHCSVVSIVWRGRARVYHVSNLNNNNNNLLNSNLVSNSIQQCFVQFYRPLYLSLPQSHSREAPQPQQRKSETTEK